MRFNIVFDNYSAKEGLQALWGFSLYIQRQKGDILFDTGSNGRVLLQNIDLLELDLKNIKKLFLSHPHWDHIGGLDTVLEEKSNVEITLPSSFSPRLINDLHHFAKSVEVVEEPVRLDEDLYSTGVMEPIGEQGLIIDTPRGVVLVVGCSHPGIDTMVKRAKEVINKEVVYAIGGFHLFQKDAAYIRQIAFRLKELGVEYVTPTHCSGELANEIFFEIFKEGYIPGGVGRSIEWN